MAPHKARVSAAQRVVEKRFMVQPEMLAQVSRVVKKSVCRSTLLAG
jgi:hypothetical protein